MHVYRIQSAGRKRLYYLEDLPKIPTLYFLPYTPFNAQLLLYTILRTLPRSSAPPLPAAAFPPPPPYILHRGTPSTSHYPPPGVSSTDTTTVSTPRIEGNPSATICMPRVYPLLHSRLLFGRHRKPPPQRHRHRPHPWGLKYDLPPSQSNAQGVQAFLCVCHGSLCAREGGIQGEAVEPNLELFCPHEGVR